MRILMKSSYKKETKRYFGGKYNRRLDQQKESANLKIGNMKIIKSEKQKCLKDLLNIIKQINISTVEVPAGEKRENGAENFPNLSKEMNIYIPEPPNTPMKVNPKRPILRYIIIKWPNTRK